MIIFSALILVPSFTNPRTLFKRLCDLDRFISDSALRAAEGQKRRKKNQEIDHAISLNSHAKKIFVYASHEIPGPM